MHWCVGIEDTAIGVPIRHSDRTLDEFELTEHDRRIEEDLDLAASLGIDSLRYGVPWYRVNPAPGVFDWDLVDRAVDHALQRELTLIIDLVHYGVPEWVEHGFVDPGYPDAIAAYGGAFAERYGGSLTHYTPLNEPAVTAAFCGETGGWPPYLTGPEGWTAVVLGIAAGIQRTTRAIRQAVPDATIVHVEAAKVVRSSPEFAETVRSARERAWLPTDLVLGRVDAMHPMWPWLIEHGADPDALTDLRREPAMLDVIGVNFYPQYSVREFMRIGGRVVDVAGGGTTDDLADVLSAFQTRYGRPVGLTETSYDGNDEERVRWLNESVSAVRSMAQVDIDVWCYTWWPLFDFVDWGIAAGDRPLEDFLVRAQRSDGTEVLVSNALSTATVPPGEGVAPWLKRMGLWRLEPSAGGLDRVETAAARAYRQLIAVDTEESCPMDAGSRAILVRESPET